MLKTTSRKSGILLRSGTNEYLEYRKRQVEESKKTPEFQAALQKRKAKLLERLHKKNN